MLIHCQWADQIRDSPNSDSSATSYRRHFQRPYLANFPINDKFSETIPLSFRVKLAPVLDIDCMAYQPARMRPATSFLLSSRFHLLFIFPV